jgi:flagellar motor switch protein FliN/FliY
VSFTQSSIDALLAEADGLVSEVAAATGGDVAPPSPSATAGVSSNLAGSGSGAGPGAGSGPPSGSRPSTTDIRQILALEVAAVVTLADRWSDIESLLQLSVGSIIEFEQAFDAELTLSIASSPIGHGHAVKVGENFGLRITRLLSVEERIEAMGAARRR